MEQEIKPRKSMIFFDEAQYIDKKALKIIQEYKNYTWRVGADYSFEQDYSCIWKPKKEKKMSRKATHADVQEALEAFAAELGLDYSTCREEIDGGTFQSKFLPKTDDLSKELTQETKDAPETRQDALERYYLGFGYGSYRNGRERAQEATILGKINAIAEHLGVTFEVQPERVVTTPTKVKAVKKTTAKTSKVTAKKKGKK